MIEFGNENKQLSFLNETITNIVNNSYDFKIFRETSITNVQIKPDSNIAPHITMGVLKGFLSQTFKIFTESSFFLSRKLLYNYQSGFRKNHSTDSFLKFLHAKILKDFDKGLMTGMILIDLQKSFDAIDHDIILKKLRAIGFSNH